MYIIICSREGGVLLRRYSVRLISDGDNIFIKQKETESMKKFLPFLFLILLLLAGCAAAASPVTVTVMLEENGNFTVDGDNPVKVRPGEDAVFSLSLNEGCVMFDADGTVWDEKTSTLTVPAVRFPSTFSPDVIPNPGKVLFKTGEFTGKGAVTVSHEDLCCFLIELFGLVHIRKQFCADRISSRETKD